jgi:hypothetical protein
MEPACSSGSRSQWSILLTFQKECLSCRAPAAAGENSGMSSAPNPQSDADQLEAAADQAIAACGGDAREAVKALTVRSTERHSISSCC